MKQNLKEITDKMSFLKVFRNSQMIAEINLTDLSLFKIGRDSGNDLSLSDDIGVSRFHLVLSYKENKWEIECVARSKQLFKNNQQLDRFFLKSGDKFSIPGYEFEFLDQVKAQEEDESQTDKTTVGMLPSVPTLVFYDQFGQVSQTLALAGITNIIGRDPAANVFIDHPKLSRKHFEISRQEQQYRIRDLGSANGTFVNGQGLTAEQYYVLSSGDEIAVFDLKLRFVLRDASFDDRVQSAQGQLVTFNEDHDEQPPEAPFEYVAPSPDSSPQGDNLDNPQEGADFKPIDFKDKKRILPFVVIIVVLLSATLFFIQEETKEVVQKPDVSVLTPFEKLTPEQREVVKQQYQMAQMYLQQGKYELARQELIKLHQLIPYYEDSKKIEEIANQGLLMIQEKEKLAAEEREKAEIAAKVMQTIKECRAKIHPQIEMFELDQCLAPIIEFDPNHPDILSLRVMIQELIEARDAKLKAKKEREFLVGQLQKLFNAAQSLDRKNLWLKAIASYIAVTKASYPDPRGLKNQARDRINELRILVKTKQEEFQKKADEFYANGEYKNAILALRDGIMIDESNQVLIGKHAEWMIHLKNLMRPIFQESILEESIGEVDLAKAKWKKITELSLTGEDYFEKSKFKLIRYGLWN